MGSREEWAESGGKGAVRRGLGRVRRDGAGSEEGVRQDQAGSRDSRER